jgi:hypothetical protein
MPAPPPESNRPSEAVVAAVTVLLTLYLVGLLLTIVVNTGSGSSAVLRTIKGRLFSPWLAPAWLDLGFDHRLTWGMPDDADHLLELAGRGPNAIARRWPDGLRGERAARWRRLARAIAADAETGAASGMLAAAVGSGGFTEIGTDDLTLRILRRPLAARGGPPPAGLERGYEARVRRVDGEVQLLAAEDPAAVAPLVRPEAAP